MNIEQLRQSLKAKWLTYYKENRQWLTKLGVWVNDDGQRRPSSSFILATLSILEPQLNQMLPLVVDLSNNPDRIVAALGLNFNPEVELKSLKERDSELAEPAVRMLPAGEARFEVPNIAEKHPAQLDEMCEGVRGQRSENPTNPDRTK